ncbi:hypothetical protein CLAIMM_09484 [Cladophialophora immunda]|nr:hypothetical protein CLAIMM_09484 [Cladophialophora immunda]
MPAVLKDKLPVDHEEIVVLSALTDEELQVEKTLVRKIDIRVLPVIVLIYIMNYIDRNNYPAARLQGLQEDLNLTDKQYQIGLSILFVGYILMQVPSNMLLNSVSRPSWYLGACTMLWGLVSALTCLATNFSSILACRFLLGFIEAPLFPGVMFYLSKWYTKKELTFRMSIFYSGLLISGAFGNLIAAGILSGLAGKRGLSAWQWLYIIEGCLTIVIGFITAAFLPDYPHTWKSLSPEQHYVANRRIALEAAEADLDKEMEISQLQGLKLAFMDPATYLLTIADWGLAVAGSFQNYFPTLAATLGYNHIVSLLLVAPPYLFMVFFILGHCYLSDRLSHRFWFFIYPQPLALVGFIIFMTTSSFGPRYFACFLFCFSFTAVPTVFSWAASSISRPPTKRAIAIAFMNCFGSTANIWTPFIYRAQDAPHYTPAMVVNIIAAVICVICAVILRWLLIRRNQALERQENEAVELSETSVRRLQKTAELEGLDIAAARRLQKDFRYLI